MITRRGAISGITSRGGFRSGEALFAVETVITPGDADTETDGDAILNVTTPATVDYEAQAIVTPTHPEADIEGIAFASTNTDVATVDVSTGIVTRVADGTVRIKATNAKGQSALSTPITIYRESGATVKTFSAWVEGTLAYDAADAIDSRIDGKDVSAKPIFAVQNHASGLYTRNTGCWAADLDLSGISPWNSRGGAKRAGVMVSPRDCLVSEHYGLAVGDTVRFVHPTTADTYADMTIAAVKNVGPSNEADNYDTDIRVCTFTEDVPEWVTWYMVLPANAEDYIRRLDFGIPTLGLDQEEKALVQDWHQNTASRIGHRIPTDAQRLAMYEGKITGDSGNLAMLLLRADEVGGATMFEQMLIDMGAVWVGVTNDDGMRGLPAGPDMEDLGVWDAREDKAAVNAASVPYGWTNINTGEVRAEDAPASLSGFDDFTLVLWLRVGNISGASVNWKIWTVGGVTGSDRSWAIVQAPDGLPQEDRRIDIRLSANGSSVETVQGVFLVEQVRQPSTGQRCVVIRRSGSTITGWIDGVQVSSNTASTGTLHTSTAPMDFGGLATGSNAQAFHCPAIFRRALTDGEIVEIYEAGVAS